MTWFKKKYTEAEVTVYKEIFEGRVKLAHQECEIKLKAIKKECSEDLEARDREHYRKQADFSDNKIKRCESIVAEQDKEIAALRRENRVLSKQLNLPAVISDGCCVKGYENRYCPMCD